jgi:hypothetical protein
VLAVLVAVWKVTPWRLLRPLFSPAYRRRVVKRIASLRQTSLRGPEPPRTVADLMPPDQRGVPAPARNGRPAAERAGTPRA